MHAAAQALQAGIERKLLPPDAGLPADDGRPWPVVLLTALGAWLAAVPLLGVVGLLLGEMLSKSAGPYLVGVLVLAAAVVVLRSHALPVFVEQLAVPGLLVGSGALAFGLFRDAPQQAAAALLAMVSLGLAWAIPRAWLRMLLGAAACALCLVLLTPKTLLMAPGSAAVPAWLALQAALLLWLLATATQILAPPRLAGLVESAAAGWLLLLLVAMCWWAGMTFLVGATLGRPGFGAGGAVASASWAQQVLLPAGSTVMGLAAAALSARRWPGLRQPLLAPVAAVFALLCWFMPVLGAVLLALALTGTSGRWRLAGAAALAAAWIIGSFYYRLQWTLSFKAMVLVGAGALLGLLALAARRAPDPTTPVVAEPSGASARSWVALAAAATVAIANYAIWDKEMLIANGQKVFVALAPVDPRSFMQGDFMQLNYHVPEGIEPGVRRPQVAARRDALGVAQLLRVIPAGAPIAADEMRIELTPKDGRWILVSDAWFFREGDGRRWEAAKYGEFRVLPDGRALLVGLADAQLASLKAAP